MDLAEATRLYQAHVEARRAAWDDASYDEHLRMDEAVETARREMEIAYLEAGLE